MIDRFRNNVPWWGEEYMIITKYCLRWRLHSETIRIHSIGGERMASRDIRNSSQSLWNIRESQLQRQYHRRGLYLKWRNLWINAGPVWSLTLLTWSSRLQICRHWNIPTLFRLLSKVTYCSKFVTHIRYRAMTREWSSENRITALAKLFVNAGIEWSEWIEHWIACATKLKQIGSSYIRGQVLNCFRTALDLFLS